MDDMLGVVFRALTQIGGGSELVPLVVFCVVLVILGLGIGLGTMRLIRSKSPDTDVDAESSSA